MSAGSKIWDALGHISLVQWVLGILGITGLATLGVYLATLTLIIRLFAPFSYLVCGLLVVGLGLWIWRVGFTSLRAFTGYRPVYRPAIRKPALRDASFEDVVTYILQQSAFGKRLVGNDAWSVPLEVEIMDRVLEAEMTVWGRTAHKPSEPINVHGRWPSCRVDALGYAITFRPAVLGGGTTLFYNVAFNWAEVRRVWPKPQLWQRLLRSE